MVSNLPSASKWCSRTLRCLSKECKNSRRVRVPKWYQLTLMWEFWPLDIGPTKASYQNLVSSSQTLKKSSLLRSSSFHKRSSSACPCTNNITYQSSQDASSTGNLIKVVLRSELRLATMDWKNTRSPYLPCRWSSWQCSTISKKWLITTW